MQPLHHHCAAAVADTDSAPLSLAAHGDWVRRGALRASAGGLHWRPATPGSCCCPIPCKGSGFRVPRDRHLA